MGNGVGTSDGWRRLPRRGFSPQPQPRTRKPGRLARLHFSCNWRSGPPADNSPLWHGYCLASAATATFRKTWIVSRREFHMLVSIQHEIDIRYSTHVSESVVDLRLCPQSDAHQTLREFKIVVGPEAPVFEYLDWQGNRVHNFSIVGAHDRSVIVTNSTIDIHPQRWRPDQFNDLPPTLPLDHRSQDYLLPHGPVQFDARLEQLASEIGLNRESRVAFAFTAVMTRLQALVRFNKAPAEFDEASVSDVLTRGEGGVQDFAHLALSLLRQVGIPARYVSGYLFQPGMINLDFHAWVEAFVPSAGWIGVDPIRGQLIGREHIILAIGRSALDVLPRRGTYHGQAQQRITHDMRQVDVQTERRDEWFGAPRFDNRILVKLMLQDRMSTKVSIEQQISQ